MSNRTKALCLGLILVAVVGCQRAEQDRAALDRLAEQLNSGQYQAAADGLAAYLERYPRDDLAWTFAGQAALELDQLDQAMAHYNRAIELNPQRVEALTGQGIVRRMRGEYDQAMQAYQRAVELDPEYAQAYSSMLVIALKQADDQAAVEYGEQALSLDPEDPVIAANLAVAYHYIGNRTKRDVMLRRARELGYSKTEKLQKIFDGQMTIRD